MKKQTLQFALSLVATALISQAAIASSHREAPNITRYPTVDSTDFYAFNSYEEGRGDYVTLIANYIPLQDAYGGPNYFAMDPQAVYSIHIDNDGDAVEDMTFQFRFTSALPNDNQGIALTVGPADNQRTVGVPLKNVGSITAANQANANFSESYSVSLVSGPQTGGTANVLANATDGSNTFSKPLDYIGNKTFTDASTYTEYANSFIFDISLPDCEQMAKVFVGQRKDPFVVNLGKTFDLVNYIPIDGDAVPGAGDGLGFPGGITQDPANDDLDDKNVTAISIEVPKACITGNGNGVIGGWTTASLRQARVLNPDASFIKPEVNGGALTQVSRLSNPLVNELIIGLADKDKFSSSQPKDDGQFADYVTHPTLPEVLNILFLDGVNDVLGAELPTIAPTNFPRSDLVTAFLTGIEGLNQLSTVTPSEMIRLNTTIAATPRDQQSPFGVVGEDLAGYPNGRRPGDDVVDIALRAVMGAFCFPIPIDGNLTDLGLCEPQDAVAGGVAFTDGAPVTAADMLAAFPYLATPIAGSK